LEFPLPKKMKHGKRGKKKLLHESSSFGWFLSSKNLEKIILEADFSRQRL